MANDLGMSSRAVVIALAVAHQESGFLNYANDGLGSDLRSSQRGIGASLSLPHDAVGTDHGSLGIFQQQWPWWGSMQELMDPATAAWKFYAALVKVPGWDQMSVTQAGQAVQHSAYPDAYADDVPLALELLGLDDLSDTEGNGWSPAGWDNGSCAGSTSYAGDVVYPLPAGSGYIDLENWGSTGSHWGSRHTGTDLSVSCGTPVLAATAGTVVVRTDQSWAGRWLVQVSTGPGELTTWYAHMQALDVANGQQVQAGQQLGQVGSLGNSTGCHLHFEVHPKGGEIYDDNINPTVWLQENVGGTDGEPQPVSWNPTGFILATFNVLGHSHTRPGGNRKGWASSRTRMRWAVQLFDGYGVDVVGLQEFQPIQKRTFLGDSGGRYAVYSPPRGGTVNSIAWRRARWQLVSATTFKVPYFEGRLTPMPIVRLRDLETGQDSIFVNVHNPASTKNHPNQGAHRAEAVRREIAAIRALTTTYKVPVYLTGDLNARAEAFCALTAGGLVTAAAGGSNDGDCNVPRNPIIDWIFGSSLTRFSPQLIVREGVSGRISDHPFVVARAAGASQ
jgi:murein DD-endopeptidase MepM/ murein hydrolase activator NlpD